MTEAGRIVRIAARGDGVTADGRHVPFTAPGDVVRPDGSLDQGPAHAVPPCRHFPECGGCQLQHLSDDAYADYVRDRVVGALKGQGVEAGEVLPAHISPAQSRRRAALKALRAQGRVLIGFMGEGTNRLVDMRECPLLDHRLFDLVEPLRVLLATPGMMGKGAGIAMAVADQGVDIILNGVAAEGLEAAEALGDFAKVQGLARLTLDGTDGERLTLWEPTPVTVRFAGHPVRLPPGAFLQATRDGESMLVAEVQRSVGDTASVADLFAGIGTFALSLATAHKVYAAEASREMVLALKQAGDALPGRVFVEHRDLFRRPLTPKELERFDAVILDPPRAGAREQSREIAASNLKRLAYVSCNPSSFARDAATLIAGGWTLARVKPIGQFRWSTHAELVASFVRS